MSENKASNDSKDITNEQKVNNESHTRKERIMKSYKDAVNANGDALKRLSQN